ncbi:MAG: pseudouridine synthase [Solirubrobacteraceae bacterium]
MRLAKYLAHAGVASRRAAERLIAAGRVTAGVEDEIAVDGRPVAPEARVVYAVNKPPGVVSTAQDTHGRPTVTTLVPSQARLYPVGRLDADSSGLILLTNDGELAYRLTHPRFEVPRTYIARVDGAPVTAAALRALRDGLTLNDGPTAPAQAGLLAPDLIELTIHEGRKRQVKRMCAAVGHPVIALRRVRFGPLELGALAEGCHRRLTGIEVDRLRAATGAED